VRGLRVRAASSVSLRSLMSTEFPQSIQHNFRVADDTPKIPLRFPHLRFMLMIGRDSKLRA